VLKTRENDDANGLRPIACESVRYAATCSGAHVVDDGRSGGGDGGRVEKGDGGLRFKLEDGGKQLMRETECSWVVLPRKVFRGDFEVQVVARCED
jgi:hypothetical protein